MSVCRRKPFPLAKDATFKFKLAEVAKVAPQGRKEAVGQEQAAKNTHRQWKAHNIKEIVKQITTV